MSNTPAIVNIAAAEKQLHSGGEKFAALLAPLTAKLGMKKLGCSVVELEPGKRGWPYHLHYGMEELFVVLEGEGTLRYDDAEHAIRHGDVIFTPTGPNTAHQIINTSKATLRYLALSSTQDTELCYYPDSKKYLAGVIDEQQREQAIFIAPEEAAVDYWEGELNEI